MNVGMYFIIAGDLHLTDKTPVCRTDDYVSSMISKLRYISEVSRSYPKMTTVLLTGDIFDEPKMPPAVEAMAIKWLPEGSVIVPGQHDLPYHNIDKYEESSLFVVELARPDITVLCPQHPEKMIDRNGWSVRIDGFWWGRDLKDYRMSSDPMEFRVALVHHHIWQGSPPWPGCTSPSSRRVMACLHNFHLVASGDNHLQFTLEHKCHLLVNPGSMMRMSADQIHFQPSVFVVSVGERTNVMKVDKRPFLISESAVSRELLEKAKATDERISAYVTHLATGLEVGLSFRLNLDRVLPTLPPPVQELIMRSLES